MSWKDRPKFIQQASEETGNEDPEKFLRSFVQRWGDYTPEILKRAVQEGEGKDKIFAIITLGLLDAAEGDHLLIPYLQSEDRQERWASAIALGRHKDDRVFSLLQAMLVENIFDFEPYSVYDWLLYQRCNIALLLGAWGKPQAASALCHALRSCWEIEQQQEPAKGSWRSLRDYSWHSFQDYLAYALGQLGAWGATCTLGLPAAHMRVMAIYMTLGSLQVNSQKLFHPVLAPLIFQRSTYSSDRLTLLSVNPAITLDPDFYPLGLEPEPVARILQERFGLSESEQVEYIQSFRYDWAEGRIEEDESMMGN